MRRDEEVSEKFLPVSGHWNTSKNRSEARFSIQCLSFENSTFCWVRISWNPRRFAQLKSKTLEWSCLPPWNQALEPSAHPIQWVWGKFRAPECFFRLRLILQNEPASNPGSKCVGHRFRGNSLVVLFYRFQSHPRGQRESLEAQRVNLDALRCANLVKSTRSESMLNTLLLASYPNGHGCTYR